MSDPPPPSFGPPADRGATEAQDSPDALARRYAVDPRHNVVLEASAGTGKTSVLVERYLNLLPEGVDPANILAITFTRKAAAEMRSRIVAELRASAARGEIDRTRWRALRERLTDISIGTIDAFCLSLLREFPLEADLEPGFGLADETEVPGLVAMALDRTLFAARRLAARDEDLALLFVQIGEGRLRNGLGALLDRRLVVPSALARFLATAPPGLTVETASHRVLERIVRSLEGIEGGLEPFVAHGPWADASYRLLALDLSRLGEMVGRGGASIRRLLDALRPHFLTADGKPRARPAQKKTLFPSPAAYAVHGAGVRAMAPQVAAILADHRRELNLIMARGVRALFAIALGEYRRALERRAVVDFAETLERAIALLGQMDEFARSRYRLESRYHHVLVDEFQDTSRAQWELVALLIRSWGEGAGLVHEAAVPPSIFVVGDRKQSIYRFRDAEVRVLEEAASFIGGLRTSGRPRRWIARSFRAVPPLLAFVNDVFDEVDKVPERTDAFRYDDRDRFPLDGHTTDTADTGERAAGDPANVAIGLVLGSDPRTCASIVADEVARILREETVRDRHTGVRRPAVAGDVAILFRARESHREYEHALETRGIPAYVYKGLGFYEADEVQDVLALIRYLANPTSNLRAAAFLRSRFVRLSDPGLTVMAPHIAASLRGAGPSAAAAALDEEDERVLARTREGLARWLPLVDRIPPAELVDRILDEGAYAYELADARETQAWENLKKLRALVRRLQNRGYATMTRVAAELQRMSAGDESNAVIDAVEAVSLMTVHAAKGLEFPLVFVVHLERGAGGGTPAIRVAADDGHGGASVSVGTYQSESDQDERAREREETKRLLYVAFTRARDRLYLSASARKGVFKPAAGSLGEVLPPSLRVVLAAGLTSAVPVLTWRGRSGVHRLRCCQASDAEVAGGEVTTGDAEVSPARPHDFSTVVDRSGLSRRSVTELVGEGTPGERDEAQTGVDRDGDLLLGRLVHRLLQDRAPIDAGMDRLRQRAERLADADERTSAGGDVSAIAAEAAARYLMLWQRDEVRTLLHAGACAFEVPFSARVSDDVAGDRSGDVIVRGTIDCLVGRPDGRLTVIELKTGAPKDWHELQLDVYARAIRAGCPGVEVDAVLLYV